MDEQRKLSWVVGIVVFSAFLEIVGLALVIPISKIIADFSAFTSAGWFAPIYIWIGSPDKSKTIAYFLAFFLLFYLLKNLIHYLSLRYQYKFVFGMRNRLSISLFESYMRLPFEAFSDINSSYRLNMISSEVNVFTGSVILPLIVAFADALVALFLIFFLLANEPLPTLIVMSIITGSMVVIVMLFRGSLPKLGSRRRFHETKRIQIARQAFEGFREIKIASALPSVTKEYGEHSLGSTEAVREINIISASPRIFIEFIMILALVVFAFYTLLADMAPAEAGTIIALFGLAGIRLMPSASRISGTFQQVRAARDTIDAIYQELIVHNQEIDRKDTSQPEKAAPLSFEKDIRFKGVHFVFSDRKVKLLDNVNLTFHKNKCYGLVGPSGSGKTTMIDMLIGLYDPAQGTVEVDGSSLSDCRPLWWKNIALVSQNSVMIDDTIRANIAFGVDQVDEVKMLKSIDFAGLTDLVAALPHGLNTNLGEQGAFLSGGQKQRIGIARAFYFDREVLIFDEATSALDKNTEADIIASISTMLGKRTIFIVSHGDNILTLCDEIIKLPDCTVTKGTHL